MEKLRAGLWSPGRVSIGKELRSRVHFYFNFLAAASMESRQRKGTILEPRSRGEGLGLTGEPYAQCVWERGGSPLGSWPLTQIGLARMEESGYSIRKAGC